MKSVFLTLCLGLLTAFPVSLWAQTGSLPDRLQRPITEDVFYFILTDRFADGDPSNNKGFDRVSVSTKDSRDDIARHGYEPSLEEFYHGGDFKGVIQKLDYLQGLGVTALWLSPVQKNRATQFANNKIGVTAAYHGYWIQDFTTVDPHWGKEADFSQLIEEAHKRGMKVFIDVIVNHTADMISYRECQECSYRSRKEFPYSGKRKGKDLNPGFADGDFSEANFAKLKDPDFAYTPFLYDPKQQKKPDWLNNILYYHNRGNSTFSGENSELGDFFGLDDLYTEHPRVVEGMIEIYSEWIRKYKFDGFRIDTVKHVNIEFWQAFIPAMRKAAKEAGIPNFFMFGEVFSGDPTVLSRYTRLGQFDSVLDFTLQGAIKEVFADGQNPEKLHTAFAADDLHRMGSQPQKMMGFLSNHDIGRLALSLKKTYPEATDEELVKRLSLAHAYLYFARGVPVLYYGDEQGFVGFGPDKGAREDMFPSKTPSYAELVNLGTAGKGSPAQDNFDTKHPLYQAFADMARVRKQEPLLQTGEYHPITDLPKGLFGFRRSIFESHEEVFVVFNLDTKASVSYPIEGREAFQHVAGSSSSSWLKEGAVSPLSYVILKRQKPKTVVRERVLPSFGNLEEGQRVAGLFYGELKLPATEEYKVSFSSKGPKDKSFVPLYTDSNAPYRAYVDGDAFGDGSDIWLRAEIRSRSGQVQTVTRKVVVDKRPIHTQIVYENGNQRTEAFWISREGKVSSPRALSANQTFHLEWPLGSEGHTLFFSSQDSKGQLSLDLPVFLDFKSDILPHLSKGPKGEPMVTIYINNAFEKRYDRLKASTGKPASLLLAKITDSPLGNKQLFVRGGMNAWQAKDPLTYEGQGVYRTKTKLTAGTIDFKVSDTNWSADLNFGAPVDQRGLTISGSSGNLSFEALESAEYELELIVIPTELSQGKQPLTILRIIPPKN